MGELIAYLPSRPVLLKDEEHAWDLTYTERELL